jgi:hypothetical protein
LNRKELLKKKIFNTLEISEIRKLNNSKEPEKIMIEDDSSPTHVELNFFSKSDEETKVVKGIRASSKI